MGVGVQANDGWLARLSRESTTGCDPMLGNCMTRGSANRSNSNARDARDVGGREQQIDDESLSAVTGTLQATDPAPNRRRADRAGARHPRPDVDAAAEHAVVAQRQGEWVAPVRRSGRHPRSATPTCRWRSGRSAPRWRSVSSRRDRCAGSCRSGPPPTSSRPASTWTWRRSWLAPGRPGDGRGAHDRPRPGDRDLEGVDAADGEAGSLGGGHEIPPGCGNRGLPSGATSSLKRPPGAAVAHDDRGVERHCLVRGPVRIMTTVIAELAADSHE